MRILRNTYGLTNEVVNTDGTVTFLFNVKNVIIPVNNVLEFILTVLNANKIQQIIDTNTQ